jgi:hypothetical protein
MQRAGMRVGPSLTAYQARQPLTQGDFPSCHTSESQNSIEPSPRSKITPTELPRDTRHSPEPREANCLPKATTRRRHVPAGTTGPRPTSATAAGGSGRDFNVTNPRPNGLACANAPCPQTFAPLAQAPHKRFCSGKCRTEWHARRQAAAKALLTRLEAEELLKHDNQGDQS